ncbi:MAG: helix-turn-helix transcriptional regulator [Ruminococcaceae bacterium]|nr:helix-turn-helix transcriptional regulator [Oscillospiraceae bacterium]
MFVGAIGYNYVHDDSFVMDCPHGTGCWLLLLMKEKTLVTVNGDKLVADKNSFLLLSPDTSFAYRAKEKIYIDDWIYLGCEAGDKEYLSELDIPTDKIIFLGNINELSQLIRFIAFEHYSPDEERVIIERHLVEVFMLKLSRSIKKRKLYSHVISDKTTELMKIRNMIFAIPSEIPDVNGLAGFMGMSCSGFQHLYKRTFGVTVKDDIIAGRMELAKQLLLATSLGIKDIVLKCGYTNEYGFMKRFKIFYGQTPTEFRNRI